MTEDQFYNARRAFQHTVWVAAAKFHEEVGIIPTPDDLDFLVQSASSDLPAFPDDGPTPPRVEGDTKP